MYFYKQGPKLLKAKLLNTGMAIFGCGWCRQLPW